MALFTRFSGGLALFTLLFGFAGPFAARAATTPSLGLAIGYGVLASTYTNTVVGTAINGSVGFTTGPVVVPTGTHAQYGTLAPYAAAGANQGTALSSLASQGCTFTFPVGAINLSTDTLHGPIGVYTPGVYCSAGAMSVAGPMMLSGGGTFIFRSAGALTSTVGSVITLSGASACDVFWTPTEAVTLAATTTFMGNVIDDAGITIGAGVTWVGRALAFGGTVTTDTDTITVPSCATSSSSPSETVAGTITVTKMVVNDNGGTKAVADFALFMNGTPVVSGAKNTFSSAAAYDVTETADAGYAATFSGDCDAQGRLSLNAGDNKVCIITNNDIASAVVVPPIVVSPTVVEPTVIVPMPLTITTPISSTGTTTPVVSATAPVVTKIIPSLPNTGFAPRVFPAHEAR